MANNPLADTCFWADTEQAQERLTNSFVLYDDTPAYVIEVTGGFGDGIPRASLYLGSSREATRKRLDSPKFGKFRNLPKLGFMNNPEKGRAYLIRRIAARTRTHGLSDNNIRVTTFHPQSNSFDRPDTRFSTLARGENFLALHKGVYPNLSQILTVLANGSSMAFARKYLVARDTDGLRWLYRETDKIGLFTGADTLNLFTRFSFCREELMEEPTFDINTIQEF
jgi:hypothetical protein